MKAIVDKKANLAKGFADVNTPSEHADELLISLLEKREKLIKKRDELLALKAKGKPAHYTDGQWRDVSHRIGVVHEQLGKIKKVADKEANLQHLLIGRLKQVIPLHLFEQCCVLARQDRKRILDQMSIAALEDEAANGD